MLNVKGKFNKLIISKYTIIFNKFFKNNTIINLRPDCRPMCPDKACELMDCPKCVNVCNPPHCVTHC